MILYVDLQTDAVNDPGWGKVGEVISRDVSTVRPYDVMRLAIELDPKKVAAALKSHENSPIF